MSKAAKRERQRQNREARREYEEQVAKRRKRLRSARNFAFILTPFVIIFAVLAITNNSGSDNSSSSSSVTCKKVSMPPASQVTVSAPTQNTVDPSGHYTATMDTTCGPITIALDAANAPVSVNSFLHLVDAGYYNNLAFVRAVKNGVIQAGSASQDNGGEPPYKVQGEVPKTTPPYPIGTVAMAKTPSDPSGTVGSQFFIVTGKDFVNLPADYALLGKVTKGMNVAQKIESFAPKSGDGALTTPVVINKITTSSGAGTTSTTAAPSSTSAP